MAQKAPTGGGNRILVMGLASPYTAPTSLTAVTSDYMLFDKNETTTITGDVRIDSATIEAASKIRNAQFVAFKTDAAVNATITSNTQVYEDGSEDKFTIVPSTAVAKRLVVAHLDGDMAGESTIVTIITALLDGSSLGSGRASGTLGDANVKFVSVPAPTTLTIPTTFFDPVSDLITAAQVVIPGTCHGTELLM